MSNVSITIHPSTDDAEYLSVADAMQHVLDFVGALEHTEASEAGERQIIWLLTEAHTNSPPFTVTATSYSRNPAISVSQEASRVVSIFVDGMERLLSGIVPDWADDQFVGSLSRIMKRNMNGVGLTQIAVDKFAPIDVTPARAQHAFLALERETVMLAAPRLDLRRTEYGALEVEVCGLSKWHDRPCLDVVDRLSRVVVKCVLTNELAEKLGPAHKWADAWRDERILVSGALHYGHDGNLKRIDAEEAEEMPWTDVSLAELQSIDVLQGRSVMEHLEMVRENMRG